MKHCCDKLRREIVNSRTIRIENGKYQMKSDNSIEGWVLINHCPFCPAVLPKKIEIPYHIREEAVSRIDSFLDSFISLRKFVGGFSVSELFSKVLHPSADLLIPRWDKQFMEEGYQDVFEYCEIDVKDLSKIDLGDFKNLRRSNNE